MFTCPICHMVFENEKTLIFGCCPLCGTTIKKDERLTETDKIVNNYPVNYWNPIGGVLKLINR